MVLRAAAAGAASLLLAAGAGAQSCAAGAFDITAFGARGDGVALDTAAIQAAIAAAGACPHGARVDVPALGGASPSAFRSGPLWLESNVDLRVARGATLVAATDFALWPSVWKASWEGFGTPGFINGARCVANSSTACTEWHKLTNVSLSGGGVVDGSGRAWWSASTWWGATFMPRPYLLELIWVDGLHISGLTLARSALWTIVPSLSRNIVIEDVFLDAGVDRSVSPYNGYNVDGLDCNNVVNLTLRNSVLHAGDDCVAINARGMDPASGDFPTRGVTIGPNVTCITPITIGSGTGLGIYDVVIRDSVVDARWGVPDPTWRPRWAHTALRFKTARNRGPAGVSGVVVSNVSAHGVDLFVDIQSYYSCQNSSGTENYFLCREMTQPPRQAPSLSPACAWE